MDLSNYSNEEKEIFTDVYTVVNMLMKGTQSTLIVSFKKDLSQDETNAINDAKSKCDKGEYYDAFLIMKQYINFNDANSYALIFELSNIVLRIGYIDCYMNLLFTSVNQYNLVNNFRQISLSPIQNRVLDNCRMNLDSVSRIVLDGYDIENHLNYFITKKNGFVNFKETSRFIKFMHGSLKYAKQAATLWMMSKTPTDNYW